jgi:hypothetical protein
MEKDLLHEAVNALAAETPRLVKTLGAEAEGKL